MSLLTTYIQHALRRAVIERIEDGTYVGEVPGLQGVLANAPTPEECRTELAEVIEGWVLVRIASGLDIPAIDGVTVVASPAR
jgi:predicted RNase H-like HicB family nuclease